MNTIRLLSTLLIMLALRPALNHTVWQNERQEFVADAGNMTVTSTLEFVSAHNVVFHSKFVMPSHPAMYVNPDGTIDTIEGWTSEWDSNGTYKYRRGRLTITLEDGETMELVYRKGDLVDTSYYTERVFRKK